MPPFCKEERIERISTIFSTFRNPDKETVLTLWCVVNIHLFQSLGGWRFFDGEFREPIMGPVYAEQDGVTKSLFKKDACSLKINSKSGLSALWCAYGVYRARKKQELGLMFVREME